MSQNQSFELPPEIKQLSKHAQQIFIAASNGVKDDNISEQAAFYVGWNSINDSYEKLTVANGS